MKNRILSIALAFGMLAMAFAAVPTHGAIDYTGSVKTTDNAGVAKSTFVQGETVYVNVMAKFQGDLANVPIVVRLYHIDGHNPSSMFVSTNNPDLGYYNSTTVGLSTSHGFIGDSTAYDVVVRYDGPGNQEIARTTIVVMNEGLTLDPPPVDPWTPEDELPYYPGQTVTASVVTTHTSDFFFVETVNESGTIVMNWTDQGAPTGFWSRTFQIPADMKDGPYWMYVKDKAPPYTQWYWEYFEVQKYEFSANADRTWYLPGETAKIQYQTIDIASFLMETGVTVTYSAHWLNSSGNDTWENATLPAASGVQEFLIPTDISLYEDVEITYWANESTRSAKDTVTLQFGTLSGSVLVDAANYVPGDTVVVRVNAYIEWNNLPGANVEIVVFVNGTSATSYGISSLTTDQEGNVVHTFKLVDSAVKGSYIVKAIISKVGVSTARETAFQVDSSGKIDVKLDKEYYTSGDTVTATFTPIWNNQEITLPTIGYEFRTGLGLLLFSNTTETTVTADLPEGYYGWVSIYAFAWYQDVPIEGYNQAEVHLADLVFTVDKLTYRPGDTVTFEWQIVTSVSAGTLIYEITDEDGVKLASDTPAYATSGSFEYLVPDDGAPGELNAKMWMTTSSGGYADAEAKSVLMTDHELKIWVEKSKYADGAFKPGDSVMVHYSIGSYINNQLPSYRLDIWMSTNPITMSVLLTEPTGKVKMVIPTDSPSALLSIGAALYDGTDPTSPALSSDFTAVTVNARNSGWDMSVAGMSASDFTIMVLIIVMILLLIVMPFLKARMEAPKAPKPEPAPPAPETPKTP
jgi:plastocyanin